MPAKALDQVLAAVKSFQQASQPLQKAAAAGGDKPQPTQDGLSPQLWLHCRLQVSVVLYSTVVKHHCNTFAYLTAVKQTTMAARQQHCQR